LPTSIPPSKREETEPDERVLDEIYRPELLQRLPRVESRVQRQRWRQHTPLQTVRKGCVSMTGEQSRLLKVGDRVRWGATTTDFGTVVETAWNGVTIDWDDGNRSSIQHNDMTRVERVPAKS
jgi:hypothetical protein